MKTNRQQFAKQLGITIASYRQQIGLTQEQIAEKLEMGNEAISRIERGVVMPTLARLIELADIFDCQLADLLGKNSGRTKDEADYLHQLLKERTMEERQMIVEVIEKMVALLEKR